MEQIKVESYIENLIEKKKAPNSERAFWIQEIAVLTGMPWKVIFGKTLHLPTSWIHNLYDDAMSASSRESKQKKFWWLLKQTKIDGKVKEPVPRMPTEASTV